jgi:hypothetical protein
MIILLAGHDGETTNPGSCVDENKTQRTLKTQHIRPYYYFTGSDVKVIREIPYRTIAALIDRTAKEEVILL